MNSIYLSAPTINPVPKVHKSSIQYPSSTLHSHSHIQIQTPKPVPLSKNFYQLSSFDSDRFSCTQTHLALDYPFISNVDIYALAAYLHPPTRDVYRSIHRLVNPKSWALIASLSSFNPPSPLLPCVTLQTTIQLIPQPTPSLQSIITTISNLNSLNNR